MAALTQFSLLNNPTASLSCVVSQEPLCKLRFSNISSPSFPASSYSLSCDFDGSSRRSRSGNGFSVCRTQPEDQTSGEGSEVDKELARALQNSEGNNVLDELAARILQEDEESKALLKDFASAAERVAKAKQELESISRQERELAQLRFIEEEAAADSLVADLERDVLAAEEEVEAAQLALVTARVGGSGSVSTSKWENEDIDEDLERIESGKAAAVSALAGVLASFPFVLTGNELGAGPLLSIGGVIVSCALFGVTYRYILRRDLGNIQLKSGAAAAFALTRGIGQVDAIQLQVGFPYQGADDVLLAALNASQGLFIFGFSAVALDYCLRKAILSPFPSKRSGPL